MPGPRIGVMLVDDHAVVRMGFRLLVDGAPDMRVVAEAASGEDAVRTIEDAQPDVVVMDISMPGIGGLEAVRRILARAPETRVLVLSAHEDAMHARRTLKAGAAGYLEREGVQGVHRARERPVGPGHRRGHVAQPEHRRHASLQHQAEAGGGELRRARAHRHAGGPSHALVSSCASRSALAAGSTARTVTPSLVAPVIAKLPPKACTRSRI